MRASTLIFHAFDGSQRKVIGGVDLPICMGFHQFTIMFQVMDIHPAYSCPLGRPWIHAVGAVTSTLHQKLMYLFEDKLVIVCSEKDSIISEISSFRYMETEEGIIEVPFQGLDFEEVSTASANPSQSTTLVLSLAKSAKQTLENGPLPGWGKIMRVPDKHDRFGLGYHPTSYYSAVRGGKRFNPIRFSNATYQWDSSVALVYGESSTQRAVYGFIHKYPMRFKLDNWMSTMVLVVFSDEI